MKLRLSLICIMFTFLSIHNAYSVNVTISSNGSNSSTTWIRSKDPTSPNKTYMWVANQSASGTSGNAEYRSLLRFNTVLSEMSGITHVESAVLRLYVITSAYENNIHIASVVNPWTPAGATWGGNQSYHDYGVSQLIPVMNNGFGSTNPGGLYDFDVTDIVNDWLDGTYANNGFMIRTDYMSGVQNSNAFYSPLYAPGNTTYDEYRPILTIQETVAVPVPEPASVMLLGIGLVGLIKRTLRRR